MSYLCLLPSQESDEALRRCVANRSDSTDFHLTIIHTPQKGIIWPPVDGAVERSWKSIAARHSGGIAVAASDLALFGPPEYRCWVLKVASPLLTNLRLLAERSLEQAGIKASRDFAFSPHVTLTQDPVLQLRGELPKLLTFDRMEWR